MKVAVIGAAGGIGQPLSLLLKKSYLISELALQDLAPHTPGVAKDLSHINTPASVKGYVGPNQMRDCVKDSHIVLIPAGVPRKPGMSRDDLFNTNATVVKDVGEAVADVCPKALVGIITNPVNSVVPIFCEVLKKAGKFDPRRVFGVTTLDLMRTSTFVAELKNLDVKKVYCPVIGGHSGVTIIPMLSQCDPKVSFDESTLKALTARIQDAGTEVVKAKAGAGSATLSMADAAANFATNLIRGLNGEENVVDIAYIASNVTEVPYFSAPFTLGRNGVEKILGLGNLSDFERALFSKCISELQKNISVGEKFVKH